MKLPLLAVLDALNAGNANLREQLDQNEAHYLEAERELRADFIRATAERDAAIAALREIETAGPENSARALQYIAHDHLEALAKAAK